MNIKIKNKLLVYLLLLILLAEFIFLIAVPKVANNLVSNGSLQRHVKQKTGINLAYETLSIKTTPAFVLEIEGSKISAQDKNKNELLKADDIDLSLYLPSLLWQKIIIKNINTNDFSFVITRKKDKKIYFGDYEIKVNSTHPKTPNIDIDKLSVNNVSITFDDKFIEQKTNLKIETADFFYKKDKNLKLVVNSGIYINDHKKTDIVADISSRLPLKKHLSKSNSKSKLFVKINDLDLSNYSKYVSYLLKQDIKASKGIIDFVAKSTVDDIVTAMYIKDLQIDMQNPLDSIKSDSAIRIASNIKLEKDSINVTKAQIKTANSQIDIKGNISKYLSENPYLDLNIDVAKANVHSMYNLVPTLKEDVTFAIRKFKKYGAWGQAKGKLNIKGNLKEPDIYGEINLSDVYIVKDNPIVPHCKIYAKFLGKNVYVRTRVFAGHGEHVDIEGTAQMKLYGAGKFRVVSSSNVDLGTAEYMLVPIHEVVGFDIGPVPYMTIKGKGNIDLTTVGTILDGAAYGQFNFMKTTATLQGLNTTLENANGVLDFKGKDMHFYTKQAFINKQPIKVDGKANLNGNIDFDITANSIKIEDLFKILNTSSILSDKKDIVSPIKKINGNTKISIKLTGVVKDFGEILKKNTLNISGNLKLNNTTAEIKDLPVPAQKLYGTINFNNNDWQANLKGTAASSPIEVNGYSKQQKTDITFKAPALKTDELIKVLLKPNKNLSKIPSTNSLISFLAHYKNNSNKIDLKKLTAEGKFRKSTNNPQNNDIVINSGSFSISNGDINLKNFDAKLFNSKIQANGKISEFYSKDYKISGKFNLSDFDISAFNTLKRLTILPPYIKSLLNAYENYQGTADAHVTCFNNNLKGQINLKNIKFNHKYFKTPIAIDKGEILLDGSKITLHSIIAQIDKTPVFLNISLQDLDKTMRLNGYFTTKLTEQFVNKYINTFLTYPIKPKGDITITTDLGGDVNNLRLKPVIKFAQGADIYYMGANLGDESEQRELRGNIVIKDNGNTFDIEDFAYKRYMSSQNDKIYPITIFKGHGIVNKQANGFYAKNLNIETKNNANVKLFNIIFKKSILKQGMFNCKLNVNGNLESPIIVGHINMHNLDMPLYDTLVKSLTAKFQGKSLYVNINGESMGSDFSVNLVSGNHLVRPIVIDKLDIKSNHVNLDKFIDSLTQIPTPNTVNRLVDIQPSTNNANAIIPSFNISDFQIKNGTLSANEIAIRDLSANNYSSNFSLGEDMVLNVDKLTFDVTTGKMMGTAKYDFSNGKIKTNISALNVDSNKVASSLFGFNDQIFGTANGNISVTTHGASEEERIKNMFGYVYFEIANGKMPKLGSVEYLLKAGNLIKSGITGASLNNFIELIAPIKTGYFESIKGSFTLKNGVAQNIEVYSKGDNLNIYINGEFDVLQSYANMRVFGRLTKRATNILGPIGNLSFNSLLNAIPGIKLGKNEKSGFIRDLNKIPGVELDNQQYRIFTVKIDGKLNENKFVKNFRWME